MSLREKLIGFIGDESKVDAFLSELETESQRMKQDNVVIREAEEKEEELEEEVIVEEQEAEVTIERTIEIDTTEIVTAVMAALEEKYQLAKLAERVSNFEKQAEEAAKTVQDKVKEVIERTPEVKRQREKIIVRPTAEKAIHQETNTAIEGSESTVAQIRQQRVQQFRKLAVNTLFGE